MPTYGAEGRIGAAIADLRAQTCPSWELIVVDDATPDRSIEEARAAAAGDPRIRFAAHERNRGLSAARNTGLALARGRYVTFPDPDDRFDADMLRCVEHALRAHGESDLAVFGHVQEHYDADGAFLYAVPLAPDPGFWEGDALRHQVLPLEQGTHLGYAWNKMFRRKLVLQLGLTFEDDAPLIEDLLFTAALLPAIQSLTCIDAVPYRYAKRLGGNLTNEFVPRYYELHRRRISVLHDLLERWGILDRKAESVLGALLGRYALSALERNCAPQAGLSHAGRVRFCRSMMDDPLFVSLIQAAQADSSRSLAICLAALKLRRPSVALALGRAIHLVRGRSTALYAKAKAGR
ncbi:glycosyltransferase family 2 protein [Eggerthellaceae bacterium zg-1084]|uniref:glycosyltransferase family 2 protein n=1 Tax=Berryella wangjianweii TaxID=2734634 RepID=UPI001557E2B4|nr:glycosyltransferase family 2 protein [Berryella wangjianweii]NPD31124.1 glycosyltransferase family 2 protein [Berryella wangjianweii]